VEGIGSVLFHVTIPIFAWTDWGNHKASVTIFGVPTEIPGGELPNINKLIVT
jgi:hypothetical protein